MFEVRGSPGFLSALFEPSQEILVFLNLPVGLVFGGEFPGVGWLCEAFSVEQDTGALAWCADESAEGLMDAAHGGEDVDVAEGFFAGGGWMGVYPGLLDSVDFGQGGADDHGGVDASAELVDAFGVAGA